MEGWGVSLLDEVQACVRKDAQWRSVFRDSRRRSIHLAVFIEPFLTYVLDGSKTVESRFSAKRCAPYACVSPGDVVLVKAASGPVVAIAEISGVWFYNVVARDLRRIRKRFGKALRIDDPTFWDRKASACFVTLMRLSKVQACSPIRCAKRDRRGWVVIQRSVGQGSLFGGLNR